MPVPALPAEADDADLLVEQDVDRDVLLGRAAAQVEHGLVGAHEVQPLVGVDARQRRLRARVRARRRCGTGSSRASARSTTRWSNSSSITVAPDLELDEAGPAGVGGELVAVLVGVEADDARLQPQRQVLA